MRPTQKLLLIEAISDELDRRYSFSEIDFLLNEFGIATPYNYDDTKMSYAKKSIMYAPNDAITSLSNELEIDLAISRRALLPPHFWKDANVFRLFISHISIDKEKATRLRDCLAPYYISGFVAHQDIAPTLQWQSEIERALVTMHAFVAIHTKGFSASYWTQQEVGFAVGRGTKIISLRMGEDPTGFISKNQALQRMNRKAEDIAKEIEGLLRADPQTGTTMSEVIRANLPVVEQELDDEIPF